MVKVIFTHILLSVGLLTLMYIDSLIVLAMPWSSPAIMLKFSSLVLCPVWVLCTWMGQSSFRCSLYLSPKVLDVSPMNSSSHKFLTLAPVDGPTFPVHRILVFGFN